MANKIHGSFLSMTRNQGIVAYLKLQSEVAA
jgi:hypothetical protein